jgi:hypothetical protein
MSETLTQDGLKHHRLKLSIFLPQRQNDMPADERVNRRSLAIVAFGSYPSAPRARSIHCFWLFCRGKWYCDRLRRQQTRNSEPHRYPERSFGRTQAITWAANHFQIWSLPFQHNDLPDAVAASPAANRFKPHYSGS